MDSLATGILTPLLKFCFSSNTFPLFSTFLNTLILLRTSVPNYFKFKTLDLPVHAEGALSMKEEYVAEILKLLEKCNDINALDFVQQYLVKKCQNA